MRISDSLVENLPCDSLDSKSILKHIRPNAFSLERHLPLKNWGGKNETGVNCWGLASAQRKFFYLARFDQTERRVLPELREQVIDLVRSTKQGDQPGSRCLSPKAMAATQPMTPAPLEVFHLPVLVPQDGGIRFPLALLEQLNQEDGLKKAVEYLSFRRNHRIRNLVRGCEIRAMASLNLPDLKDHQLRTLREIEASIAEGVLPLLQMSRENSGIAHIVLAKSVRSHPINGDTIIHLYDSDDPSRETLLIFRDGRFYYSKLDPARESSFAPLVQVHIEDRDEMGEIIEALLRHYRQACSS